MPEIASSQQLEAWLTDKPFNWTQGIALRVSLRVLPIAINHSAPGMSDKYASALMRAHRLTWGGLSHLIQDSEIILDSIDRSASTASTWSFGLTNRWPIGKNYQTPPPASRARELINSAGITASGVNFTMLSAFRTKNESETTILRQISAAASSAANLIKSIADVVYFEAQGKAWVYDGPADQVGRPGDAWDDVPLNRSGDAATLFWKAISFDAAWLSKNNDREAVSRLSALPLWPQSDSPFSQHPSLRSGDEWFLRRIEGHRTAFDIPGDIDRAEDYALLMRLAEATEEFWNQDPKYVSAELQSWLDEARERVAANLAEGAPEQNPKATVYGINELGLLDRLPSSEQVHLRDELDQRRSYADIREAAEELAEEGQRLGPRLARALTRFLASLPATFEEAESYTVWRDANKLRRIYYAHQRVANYLEPDDAKLEPVVAESLGGLLDLYNNFAFADDGLRAKDEGAVPPQERIAARKEAELGRTIDEALREAPQIITNWVREDILADNDPDLISVDDVYSAQMLVQANQTRRNRIAALLSGTMRQLKLSASNIRSGAEQAVGNTAYTCLIVFVSNHAPALLQYASTTFHNASVQKLIDFILLFKPH